jgi:hypothetical protein
MQSGTTDGGKSLSFAIEQEDGSDEDYDDYVSHGARHILGLRTCRRRSH